MRRRRQQNLIRGFFATALLCSGESLSALATNLSSPASEVGGPSLDAKLTEMAILQMDLVKALELVSEQAQVRIVLAKGLAGQVTNLRIEGTARNALDQIAEKVGALWWWNGSEVRIASRADITTRTLTSKEHEQLLVTARQIKFPMELLTVTRVAGRSMRVSGPTGLLADFEALNEEVNKNLRSVSIVGYGKRRTLKVD